jgi:phosphohistidine phosphatase
MKLYVVRHGEAEPFSQTDSSRNLTMRGKEDSIDLGVYLSRQHVHWDAIVVSPYNRAQQTLANILLSFPQHPAVLINANITPENMVSHMPLVSGLISTLVTGHERDAMNYFMVTSSVAELDVDELLPGAAKLSRLLSPPYEV